MSRFFYNDRDSLVDDAIAGIIASTPHHNLARLDVDPSIRVVLRSDWDKGRVAVISGGGSGHEPAHAGFVGRGMLTAAVCGNLFASPSVEAILHAIMALSGDRGCLLIVKNYTGDRLNFGLAAERARRYGLKIKMVIVADDIALPDNPQPRGLAGTVLVHKIAGYAAEQGKSLDEVHAIAQSVCDNLFSIGAAIRSASLPGSHEPERIASGETELGLGIHGEPGATTLRCESARELIDTMVERLEAACGDEGRLAVLLNNLGGTSELEMGVLAHALAESRLAGRIDLQIGPATLVSSLDMKGFSITALRMKKTYCEALLAPVETSGWRAAIVPAPVAAIPHTRLSMALDYTPSDSPAIAGVVDSITRALIASEKSLNTLDAKTGDGDTGSTFAAGARDIAKLLQQQQLPLAEPALLLMLTGERLAVVMGGSSGVLMSIFFTTAGQAVSEGATLPDALLQGLAQMQHYGGAQPGDRTLIDALLPALESMKRGEPITQAAQAARDGAQATAAMTRAGAGRSSYVNAANLKGVEDPGAAAIAAVFDSLAHGQKS
ncbi:dihydroxyacetone kinase [Salmonella enterica subsp. enterica serovar Choleraesuis]|nr:dihydroxyacetone kinase [Salmonella enterica subsp. enterica serovar Choleraesuis]